MFEDYMIPTRRRTVEDVLSVFVGWHRHRLEKHPKMLRQFHPSMDMTLKDWFDSEFVAYGSLMRNPLNRIFKTTFTPAQWKAITQPEKTQTLGDLCRAIAESSPTTKTIEPVRVLGQPCKPAGVFAALASKTRHMNAQLADITPSTSFAIIAQQVPGAVLEIAYLAPELICRTEVLSSPRQRRLSQIGCLTYFGLNVAFFASLFGSSLIPAAQPIALLSGLGLALWYGIQQLRWEHEPEPYSVQIDGVRTIADFCRAVASGGGRDGVNAAR